MVTDLNHDLKLLLASEIATSAVGLAKVSVGYGHSTNGLSKRTHVLSKSLNVASNQCEVVGEGSCSDLFVNGILGLGHLKTSPNLCFCGGKAENKVTIVRQNSL